MTTNVPKTPKPEDIVNEVINGFIKGFATPPTKTEPAVDPIKETNRLLKMAETAPEEDAQRYLAIADRHIAVIDIAVSSQKS